MKLAYCIPGKLWWVTDFLDEDIYKGIHDAIIKQRKQLNLQSVINHWPHQLTQNLKAPDRVDVSQYEPFEDLKKQVRTNQWFNLPVLEKMFTTIHHMKKDSGINWHNDGSWKYGATYYINRRWNIHWGGEFMFATGDAHGFLPITGNSLVMVKAPLDHKVNPVLSPIMPRISVQMFMK
tara:strand:- start:208 stop:741 length:534 start_codon:yes stop_codon:yes gene_type:complete